MRSTCVIIGIVAMLGAGMIGAQGGNSNLARELAATCVNCHGPGGVSQGIVASLAGQRREDLIGKLREFKAGTRPATVMQQLAKGYTDEQLELIADWFARQPVK